MRIRHGGLSLDVPGHYRDESTLLFVGVPEPKGMLTVNAVEEPPEAITVTLHRGAGDDPRAFLRAEADEHAKADPQFELVSEGPLEAELGTGWLQERLLIAAGERVGQLVAAFALGPVMVCGTASAKELVFSRRKAHLLEVLTSLRTEMDAGGGA